MNKNKNKDLSDEQIIKDVNMDLDKKQYEDIKSGEKYLLTLTSLIQNPQ